MYSCMCLCMHLCMPFCMCICMYFYTRQSFSNPHTFSSSACEAFSSWLPFFSHRLHSPTYMLRPMACSHSDIRSESHREKGTSKSLCIRQNRMRKCREAVFVYSAHSSYQMCKAMPYYRILLTMKLYILDNISSWKATRAAANKYSFNHIFFVVFI